MQAQEGMLAGSERCDIYICAGIRCHHARLWHTFTLVTASSVCFVLSVALSKASTAAFCTDGVSNASAALICSPGCKSQVHKCSSLHCMQQNGSLCCSHVSTLALSSLFGTPCECPTCPHCCRPQSHGGTAGSREGAWGEMGPHPSICSTRTHALATHHGPLLEDEQLIKLRKAKASTSNTLTWICMT